MTAIRELLSRARLLDHWPAHQDIVPPQDDPMPAWDDENLWNGAPPGGARAHAAEDLNSLCEVMVARTLSLLCEEFITERLPAPECARLIGCILQLADAEDSARFWWQYAAGAGDETASYCLHLHHLSLGEADIAALWNRPTNVTPQAPQQEEGTFPARIDVDWNVPTILRLLTALTAGSQHRRAAIVEAVLDYVPDAVVAGHSGSCDLDIPLPKPGFAEQIKTILTAAARGAARRTPHTSQQPALPGRPITDTRLGRGGLRPAGA